jgi:hypothetical protein
MECAKTRNEGRNLLDRSLVAYPNEDLFYTFYLATVKYCFVLWSEDREFDSGGVIILPTALWP